MKYFVTGGAGFIGSHFVEDLLNKKNEVVVFDNFSTGQIRFLENIENHKNLLIIRGDLLDKESLESSIKGCDTVYHFAANADVMKSFEDPYRDFNQNLLATMNLLDAMRKNKINKIIFSSTAAALGEPETFPTSEDCPIPSQTSLYGASKIGAEAMISAFCEGYGFEAYIFRFVSLLGSRYPHGHVFDFVKQLITNKNELIILGNGKQKKSFLNIKDCVKAINLVAEKNKTALKNKHNIEIYHLGNSDFINIKKSAAIICNEMSLNPKIIYKGGERGWVGDSPFVFLDISKIKNEGWKPEFTIEHSIRETVRWLIDNQWIFDLESNKNKLS